MGATESAAGGWVRGLAALAVCIAATGAEAASCSRFDGSTAKVEGAATHAWRTDFPAPGDATSDAPWEAIDFAADPRGYMFAVLDTVREDFARSGPRLEGTGSEDWWIVPWMDYTNNGREPLMGLTRERMPMPGDLSPTSTSGHQVWAVGFYNAPGAAVVGEIFADPCDPTYPEAVSFPVGTASVKFLFTDAPADQVRYLDGGPTYHALIDPPSDGGRPTERVRGDLRLLQVDIGVRDERADPVGWVFGTFVWLGLPRGDGVFDNLEPVSLQWGDDPGVIDPRFVRQSWINPRLEGVTYGWADRPWLGFHGRANGPADNIRSSCMSCHASARIPPAPGKRLLNHEFHMVIDLADKAKVRQHVADWFVNLPAGTLFSPDPSAVSALDYSLQLSDAAWRMCSACADGALTGPAPSICSAWQRFSMEQCGPRRGVAELAPERGGTRAGDILDDLEELPSRQ